MSKLKPPMPDITQMWEKFASFSGPAPSPVMDLIAERAFYAGCAAVLITQSTMARGPAEDLIRWMKQQCAILDRIALQQRAMAADPPSPHAH